MFPVTVKHEAGRVAGGGGKGQVQLALVHAVEQVGRKAAAAVLLVFAAKKLTAAMQSQN